MAKDKKKPAKKKKAPAKPAAKKITKPAKKSAKKSVPEKTKSKPKVTAPKKKAAKKARRKPETLMCFLTTACVNYYNLPDNGYELNTLRHYRDSYLAESAAGKKLVRDYYKIAPQLVEHIEQDEKKKSVYAYIYSEVRSACREIENKKPAAAKRVYQRMVTTLTKKYF